jgi:hypothetical protein
VAVVPELAQGGCHAPQQSGSTPPPSFASRRSDANASGTTDIADASFLLSYLFASGAVPACLDAADANDNGDCTIADAVTILSHLFANAGPLQEPFGRCGYDPTDDDADCGSFPPCE